MTAIVYWHFRGNRPIQSLTYSMWYNKICIMTFRDFYKVKQKAKTNRKGQKERGHFTFYRFNPFHVFLAEGCAEYFCITWSRDEGVVFMGRLPVGCDARIIRIHCCCFWNYLFLLKAWWIHCSIWGDNVEGEEKGAEQFAYFWDFLI